MSAARKLKHGDPSIVGSIYSPITVAAEVPARRRGRKSKAEKDANPYTVFQEKKTGGWYIRYTDPVTKKVVRAPLKPAGAGQTATKHETQARLLAVEVWKGVHEKASRVAQGLEADVELRVAKLVAKYIGDVAASTTLGKAARRDYIRHMKTWCRETDFARHEDVRLVKNATIKAMAQKLEKATRCNKRTGFREVPFTRGMVRAHLITLAAFYKWLRSEDVNVANAVLESEILATYPKTGRGDDHLYTPIQVQQLLRAADAYRYTTKTIHNRTILYVVAYTGARICEALSLRVCDISFEDNTITLHNAKRTAEEKAQNLRGTRTFAMWRRLRSVLREHIERHGLKAGDLLFPKFVARAARGGRKARKNSGPYEWMKTLCERAGVPYKSGMHVWRHTVISVLGRMQKRLPIPGRPGEFVTMDLLLEDVQRIVGHVHGSKVTTAVYTHAVNLGRFPIYDLDYDAIVEMIEASRNAIRQELGAAYHPADVAGMEAAGSAAELMAAVPAPEVFEAA